MDTSNSVILFDAENNNWLRFRHPVEVVSVNDVDQIINALKSIECKVNTCNLYAAGFISYEAAPAFDSAYTICKPDSSLPLLWFGLYRKPDRHNLLQRPVASQFEIGTWQQPTTYALYKNKIAAVKRHIAAGRSYQVNYTQKLHAKFTGNTWNFFVDIASNQQAPFAAFIDCGSHALCSVSPELFFSLHNTTLISRPMKGTAARGLTLKDDNAMAQWLACSEKNRAENIMIVDMIRNDMGRIAQCGSVRVPRMFTCERHPGVWQMTSTVTSKTHKPVADIIGALFPCASITGAPKIETMRIISKLENEPRGVYTGAIGYIAPKRKAVFSVAIRTALIDKRNSSVCYGTGGGIVWQSQARSEFDECRIKASVLTSRRPAFSLLETMLWTPDHGFFLLSRHMKRLGNSAEYFGYPLRMTQTKTALLSFVNKLPKYPHKVRMTVDNKGNASVTATRTDSAPQNNVVRLRFAQSPIDTSDCFMYHKTTHRLVYETAKTQAGDCDDVLLFNNKNEVTETGIANIVIRLGSKLVTPPVSCGLLAGTFRDHLVRAGKIMESVLSIDEVKKAREIFVVNSVRKWRKALLMAD